MNTSRSPRVPETRWSHEPLPAHDGAIEGITEQEVGLSALQRDSL